MPLGRPAGADKGVADLETVYPLDSLEARELQDRRPALLVTLRPHRHLIHQLIFAPKEWFIQTRRAQAVLGMDLSGMQSREAGTTSLQGSHCRTGARRTSRP